MSNTLRATDDIPAYHNVRIRLETKCGILVQEYEGHNILTNVGRKWIRNLLGASAYPDSLDPTPASYGGISGADRVQYVALGCGGALQTNSGYNSTQLELVTVETLEDPVKITPTTWMQEVSPQNSVEYFPDDFTIRFEALFSEEDVTFDDNETENSSVAVGTNVPVSEIALLLSSADPTLPLSDPLNAGKVVAYNIFTPIPLTPNLVFKVEWEKRT